MTNSSGRELVEAFYQAYIGGDAAKVAEFLHDDVTWTINGPVDLIKFCGMRRGKAAVIDLAVRVIPSVFKVVSFTQESILADGDRVATLNRIVARRCADGRTISYRLAHFFRIHDDKIVDYVALLDSFDAAEQMIGHPLSVRGEGASDDSDLVAI